MELEVHHGKRRSSEPSDKREVHRRRWAMILSGDERDIWCWDVERDKEGLGVG